MFGVKQVMAMDYIVNNESGFRVDAVNKNGGACGLGQALPCKKMGCGLSFADLDCQVKWVLSYVSQRYGDPVNAQKFWQEKHWY